MQTPSCSKTEHAVVTRLEWDSAFFGFPVAKVTAASLEELQEQVSNVRRDGVRLVYGYCPADSVETGKSSWTDSRPICTQVTFQCPAESRELTIPVGYTLQPHRSVAPEQQLLELAETAGTHSRFRVDSRLPVGSFERMYAIWAMKSVSGELADIVYVTRDSKGNLAGFASGTIQANGICCLGLIAIQEEHQRRGLGKCLVDSVVAFGHQRGCAQVQVTTQDANIGAIRLYKSAGFELMSRMAVFHFWFDDAAAVP